MSAKKQAAKPPAAAAAQPSEPSDGAKKKAKSPGKTAISPGKSATKLASKSQQKTVVAKQAAATKPKKKIGFKAENELHVLENHSEEAESSESSSDSGDSPPVKKAADSAKTAEAAQPATLDAKEAPSVIRKLQDGAELQVLLKGSGSSGSGGSGGSGNGSSATANRRPSGPRLVLICFSAKWCRPCQVFAPKLELMAQRFRQVAFVKLDVDIMPDIADQYHVRSLPNFLLFRTGILVGSVKSPTESKIETLLLHNGAVPLDESSKPPAALMQQQQQQEKQQQEQQQEQPVKLSTLALAAKKYAPKD